MFEDDKIHALSIDTSIFDAYGKDLNGIQFSLLKKILRKYSVSLVISDVVWREIRKHLLLELQIKKKKFDSNILGLCHFVGGDAKEVEALKIRMEKMPSEKEHCEKILRDFLESSGGELLKASDLVELDKIIDDYFEGNSPFQVKGDKKNEFPDAIALNSIRTWSEKTKKNILLISRDDDWVSFCARHDSSQRLYVLKNLESVTEMLIVPDEDTEAEIQKYQNDLANKNSYLFKEIVDHIEMFDWDAHVSVTSSPGTSVRIHGVFAEHIDFTEVKPIKPIELDPLNLSVNVVAKIKFDVFYEIMAQEGEVDSVLEEFNSATFYRELPIRVTIEKIEPHLWVQIFPGPLPIRFVRPEIK
ncbi:hypothetical protein C798_15265 [Herbaspirillum rubrisubalbicans Os34]|uniref:DUF4935 domain-containing protein n=2 Tax=Herbaspirillum rubrisubalbicans TaxID=80842 RepID=A0A6M3ZSM3_9BURK|nr:hypothetical protein C798_15265 [Herbaspirillum rubrisubalbicans Os34]